VRVGRVFRLCVVFVAVLALAEPAAAQESTVHVVQPGENLFRIALRYGVTVEALAAANGVRTPGRIYVGQRLIVPSAAAVAPPAAPSGVHIVQPGENLFRIALRYGTTYQSLAVANGIVNAGRIYVGQRLAIPAAAEFPPPTRPALSELAYTVQRGDTLSAISLRYGVSPWALAQANGICNPSLIYAGQVLQIPATAGPSRLPAPAGGNDGRRIDVDLSAQRLDAYEGDLLVRSTLVSTGLAHTPTPRGRYYIYVKYVADDMAGPGYYLPAVPHVMYFYRGYAIHGTYWHSNFGSPMSHGCINLPESEARWLYSWASVGTVVDIHD